MCGFVTLSVLSNDMIDFIENFTGNIAAALGLTILMNEEQKAEGVTRNKASLFQIIWLEETAMVSCFTLDFLKISCSIFNTDRI